MKSIFKLFLAFAMSVAFLPCINAQENETVEGRVVIAVNTDWGVGYFTDENGKFLFNKQFDEVNIFHDGFAVVKANGKYGFVNTSGELVIPCIYDDVCTVVEEISLGFNLGLCMVREGEIIKVINKDGKVIISQCSEETDWSMVE